MAIQGYAGVTSGVTIWVHFDTLFSTIINLRLSEEWLFINLYVILRTSINLDELAGRRTENPCVGGSIPPLATNKNKHL
ncbi:hypothetical protein ATY38_11935 [Nitrosomonas ureae]|nr:hypothetical protein ATY38_11935 [Nitrosomonas ureae]